MKPQDEEQGAASAREQAAASPRSATAATRIGRTKTPSNFIGRHRLQAAISHLDQQIRVIQDELNELDSVGGPSTVCNELISEIESSPDPLLPITRGPVDISCERWFGGGSSSRTHRRWI